MIKYILIAIIFMVVSAKAMAQPWMNHPYLNKTKTEATFFDIQKAFYTYWGNKPYVRSKGYKQFKRWEYNMQPKCYPDGKFPDPMQYNNEYKKFLAQNPAIKYSKALASWLPLGLTSWTNGQSGYNPGNGRLNAVTVDRQNPNIIYVAAPSGGIWKSNDAGMSWNTTFDTMDVLGTSAVAIHPTNPNIIYIGTGDRDAWDTKGTGIYKSIDGGSTWTPTAMHFAATYRNFNKILINPLNPNRILAAASNGIFSSKNGGNSWVQVYTASEVKDLKYKPNDTTVVFGSGAFFVRSSNGGNSFTKITAGIPNDTVRIEFDVTKANANYVYAVVSRPDNTFEGVYRSTDAGLNFIARTNSPNILGYSEDGSDSSGQAWYDLALAVSPTNANEVFVGGVNVWKSTDGGQNFSVNTMWYTGSPISYIHCDIHSLNFYGDSLYCGSDGGIFLTADHGNSWIDLSAGLGICQFYRLGSSESAPYEIAAGAQDVGSNLFKNSQWTHVYGADGMEAIVNNFDSQNIYVSSQSGGILKSTDGGDNFNGAVPFDTLSGSWVTPYVMDANNGDILWAGYQEVYKTTDAAGSWTQLSTNLSGGENLNNLVVGANNNNYIYASSSEYLYVSTDGGANWNTYNPAPGQFISYITLDPDNATRIWMTITSNGSDKVLYSPNAGVTFTDITGNLTNMGFNCIAFQKNANDALYVGTEIGIFYKDTTMTNWISFNTDLPNVKVNELEINYGIGKIRAATYGRGIWEATLYNQTSIQEMFAANFKVYPNPAKGVVNIQLDKSLSGKLHIKLFTIVGSVAKQSQADANGQLISLDVSSLVAGSYFLRISSASGTFTKKIVVIN
ncbi:MAG: T9SS type A sorting domain-containing protein [Bacteroidota bacterium]